MNYRLVSNILGKVMLLEAALMIPSLIVSLIYKEESASAFLITIVILAVIGFGLSLIKAQKN